VPGLKFNPCLRGSGVQRNPESKRERYVPHDEYRDVYACANRAVRLMMALTYRTLQRPESDIILWDRREVVKVRATAAASWCSCRTRPAATMVIAFSPELDALIPPFEVVTALHEPDPLVRTLKGEFYTYDGLCSMLKKAIKREGEREARKDGAARDRVVRLPRPEGQGRHRYVATRTPIEEIQQLLGHANKTTTEIYVKQRWREAAQPNTVRIA
jgi:integrase